MTKHGGIRDVISLFRRLRRSEELRFLSPDRISSETGISVERTRRILTRGVRDHTVRRSNKSKEVYTLTAFDS